MKGSVVIDLKCCPYVKSDASLDESNHHVHVTYDTPKLNVSLLVAKTQKHGKSSMESRLICHVRRPFLLHHWVHEKTASKHDCCVSFSLLSSLGGKVFSTFSTLSRSVIFWSSIFRALNLTLEIQINKKDTTPLLRLPCCTKTWKLRSSPARRMVRARHGVPMAFLS